MDSKAMETNSESSMLKAPSWIVRCKDPDRKLELGFLRRYSIEGLQLAWRYRIMDGTYLHSNGFVSQNHIVQT